MANKNKPKQHEEEQKSKRNELIINIEIAAVKAIFSGLMFSFLQAEKKKCYKVPCGLFYCLCIMCCVLCIVYVCVCIKFAFACSFVVVVINDAFYFKGIHLCACVCRKICAVYSLHHHLLLIFLLQMVKFVFGANVWVVFETEGGVYKCVRVCARILHVNF